MKYLFVIVEPDPLVSLDLVDTVRQAFPDCDLISAGTIAELSRIMPRPDSDHVLIINSQLATGDSATVLEDMAVYGCRFIFVGGHVETPYPAAIVHTPFTTDMIVRSIASAVPSRPESPPADHT